MVSPDLDLTHLAVGLLALAIGVLVAWLHARGRIAALRDQVRTLQAEAARAREEVDALMPQARQALSLEMAMTVKQAELSRLQVSSAAEADDLRRRLRETESMTGSLQDALEEARGELAAAHASMQRQIESAPVPQAATTGAQQARAQRLDELSRRLAEIARASQKWQRSHQR